MQGVFYVARFRKVCLDHLFQGIGGFSHRGNNYYQIFFPRLRNNGNYIFNAFGIFYGRSAKFEYFHRHFINKKLTTNTRMLL